MTGLAHLIRSGNLFWHLSSRYKVFLSNPYFEEQHYRSSEESCDKAKISSIALLMKEPSFRFPFCLVCQQNVSRLQQQATPKFQLGLWVVLIQLSAQAAFIESNLIWSRYNQQRLSLKLSLRFPKNSPKSLSYKRNQGFDFYCYLQGVERGNTGWVNGKGVFLVSCHSVLYEDIF